MASWLDAIKNAIADRDAAKKERSSQILRKLMALPVERRFEATVEDLSELLPGDRRRFFASLGPQANIKIGLDWRAVTGLTVGAMMLTGGMTLGGAYMLGGRMLGLDATEAAVIETMRTPEAQEAMTGLGRAEVVTRLSAPSDMIRLASDLAQNRQEFERLKEVAKDTPATAWIDVARFMSSVGPEGAEFVQFAITAPAQNPKERFLDNLFALLPNKTIDDNWSDTLKRLIKALAAADGTDIAFSSDSHAKVAVLSAIEKLDRTRRDSIIAVLDADERDMLLVAEHGLPIPLTGDQRIAYETILGFEDRTSQIAGCLRGSKTSQAQWGAMEWAESNEGQTAKEIMDSFQGTASQGTPKPCLRVFEPESPEWRAVGSWYRYEGGERKNMSVCLIETPDP